MASSGAEPPAALVRRSLDAVLKSPQDARQYRALELTNGLKVLLISDPDTDKASAALDVNIGYLSDPDDLPGLAHFCEHMLFLGTEKYPEENQYGKFLSEHGGGSNAFTSGEHTNFYFDVAPEHLAPTLDRFAQFFVAPLFTAGCTAREVSAVDAENEKNLQSDTWRLHQLEHSLADPGHAFAKFGTGNRETLEVEPKGRGQDVRDALLQFHAKHYSANIMGLAVLGRESLDELGALVLSLFGSVPNKNVKVPEWKHNPCGPDQLKKVCSAVPIKDLRSLSALWPVPDLRAHYKSSPGHYLGHLIGHEGKGSLLSELMKKGWVNTLMGGVHEGAKGFMFFGVNVDLTEEGIEHVSDIVTHIYQYINMLKKECPQEWIFRECERLSEMSFRFKDKENPSSYTCACSAALHEYPLEEVLSAEYLHPDFKPDLIQLVVDKLTPDNMKLTVVGHKFKDFATLKEKWYGTAYALKPFSESDLKLWGSAGLHPNLHLPDHNDFLAANFDLVKRDTTPCRVPMVLRDTDMVRLWYRQDDKFLLPKACISIDFNSPHAYADPLSTDLTYMFVSLLNDSLIEYTYAAELAGIRYDLYSSIYGLVMSVRGYHDKQSVLLERLMERMTRLQLDPQRFDILLENYVRGLKNFRAEQPHQHAIYYTNMLTAEVQWTKEELLEATSEVTLEHLAAFVPQLFSQLHVEMLVYGNVTHESAQKIADIVEHHLVETYKTRPLLEGERRRYREIQLPDGETYVYRGSNDVHRSTAVELYYQCGVQDTAQNSLLELLTQLINEPCFDILRTQEQLGYMVFCGVRRSNGVQGLRVIVQSDKCPAYVESRVEAFLHSMRGYIEEMSAEVFERHVNALATHRLDTPKRMSSQNYEYLCEITTQQYHFDRDEVEAAHLRTLTKDDVLAFYKDLIAYDAPKRRKLTVYIIPIPAPPSEGEETVADVGQAPDAAANGDKVDQSVPQRKKITDVLSFKKELPLYPLPKPYAPIGLIKP